MPENFEPRQIFITHEGMWEALKVFAGRHNLHLDRIPDGANEDGIPFFKDPDTDEDFTPTYAFMPKDI